jgi:hypothetical protein
MSRRLDTIVNFISAISGISITEPFIESDLKLITGKIALSEGIVNLDFFVTINPFYPFQLHGSETIRFENLDLIKYNHVMADGLICIHTSHSPDLEKKLSYDLNSLRQWVNKYYINVESDDHYEHIIVQSKPIEGIESCFLFTDLHHEFKSGDFGQIEYSWLNLGMHEGKKIDTFLVQTFNISGKTICSRWSNCYASLSKLKGMYVFLPAPPVHNKRFAVRKWSDLEPYVNSAFKDFFYRAQNNNYEKREFNYVPLLVGYSLPNGVVHWQCAAIEAGVFPVYQKRSAISRLNEKKFDEKEIGWLQTRNTSPNYFFGRGTLAQKLIDAKILIIGIGAVGSNLAATFVRGGCVQLFLADYDVKEPENVCRSEYPFSTGLNSKVADLTIHLQKISPFVEVNSHELFTDQIKYLLNNGYDDHIVKEVLEKYDFIFDCSADNDLAYLLDKLKLQTRVLNLSITNHARELTCVTNPNLYEWLVNIFQKLNTDLTDLYNPTGCWNPTFKASYNDIATLVQFAIKQINLSLESSQAIRNFYLQTANDRGEFSIKLNQF